MLTKTDLKQLADLLDLKLKIEREEIIKLLREDIEVEAQRTREELQAEIKLTKIELSNRLTEIEKRLKSVETKISYFDGETIKLGKRITTIEEHPHFATS